MKCCYKINLVTALNSIKYFKFTRILPKYFLNLSIKYFIKWAKKNLRLH